jgi:D-alanyl-lipoteichoic acid acyltransferase DltB (MBOAT superfamily)
MNLTITMFVCAMWHKVNLPYVVWGLLQGCGLALHKLWLEKIDGSKALGKDMKMGKRIGATVLCFSFMTMSWPMICMDSWEGVMDIYTKIFTNFSAAEFMTIAHKAGFALVLVALGYIFHFLPKSLNTLTVNLVSRSGFVGQLVVMVITIWIVMQAQIMLAGNGGLPVYAAF